MTLEDLIEQLGTLYGNRPDLGTKPVLVTCDERVKPFFTLRVAVRRCNDCSQESAEIMLEPR